MRVRCERRELMARLLVVLIAFHTLGTSLFVHSHVVDGITVVHSHPAGNGHSHTAQGAATFAILSNLQATAGTEAIGCPTPSEFIISCAEIDRAISDHAQQQGGATTLRGPPSL